MPETLLDILRDIMVETACQIVADQGVEIHQWLRDEKARRTLMLAQGLGGSDDAS